MTTQHNKFLEPAREIEVVHRTGVLVVGSGPGGLAAALAAAAFAAALSAGRAVANTRGAR